MKNVKNDIRYSFTIPASFYSSNTQFQESIDKIFATTYQLTTHQSDLKDSNSVYPFTFIDNLIPEPLFLINENKGIKCYSNVCTHRGNLLIDKPMVVKNGIVCGYHGRRFSSTGKFISMPKTEGMKNFPCERDDLPEVSCNTWKQFIFTSIDPLFDFNDLIKDVNNRIGWMPIEDFAYREDLSKEYVLDANWALYCDNYLEGFHIPFIHKDLHSILDFDKYDIEIFKYSNLQIGYAKDDEDSFNLPKESKDYGKKIAAYYFWLFPNIMLNFYPWGLSVNIITPLSVNKTRIQFKTYVWKEDLLNKGAGADVNKVELEDQEIVRKVQKGVNSRLYKRGRFSPTMEQGVHHFHNLIRQFIQYK